ncbi:MAG: rhodanese-like domain-containing protein [Burkholderiaceae bacterium]|jgi:rhodanese-related sulfurtransferase|nr:rhodanese-like domain-containing protein [Burkholderiaceae bacterium]
MDFLAQTDNLVLAALMIISGMALFMPTLSTLITGKGLSPTDATIWINRRKATVIDLRSEEDFKAGHLPNAKNLVLESLESGLKTMKLDQKLPVVLIGRGPTHSQKAAKELRKLGFAEVGVLDGGIGAWQTSGLPLIK